MLKSTSERRTMKKLSIVILGFAGSDDPSALASEEGGVK
jgi:hypothetical protein